MSAKQAYEHHRRTWSDIQEHLERLYCAAKGMCLEIGVRNGCSTSALLAGLEEHGGHLWSIDLNDCRVFEGHPQWIFFQGNSLRDEFNLPEMFDVAFIDGDHSYEGALIDLVKYGSRAEKIFVHDTDAPNYPGVRKAVDFFVNLTGRKVMYHSGSFGMAEIQ